MINRQSCGHGLSESVTILEKLLSSDDDDIVDAAHEALTMLGGGEFDNAIDEEDYW